MIRRRNLLALGRRVTISINTIGDLLHAINRGRSIRSAFTSVMVGLDREIRGDFPTMAVTLDKGNFRLIIGQEMADMVTDEANHKQLGIILCHELMHIVQGHVQATIKSFSTMETEEEKVRWSKVNPLAVDYAVNSVCINTGLFTLEDFLCSHPLQECGTKGVYRGVIPTDLGLEWDLTYKQYFKILWDMMDGIPPADWQGMPTEGDGEPDKGQSGIEKAQELIAGTGSTYAHMEDLGDLEGLSVEELDNLIASADQAQQAIHDAVMSNLKSRGFGSSDIVSALDKIKEPPKVNWRQLLQDYCLDAKHRAEERQSTSLLPNLAWIDLVEKSPFNISAFPGSKRGRGFKVGCFIDTSASVSSEELSVFLREIEGLMEPNVTVLVIHCDTEITKVEEFDPGETLPPKVWGRGGTSFDPPFEYINANSTPLDLVVYFTDGGAPLPLEENRVDVPLLWCITPRGHAPGDWSRRIPPGEIAELSYGDAICVDL